MNIDQAYAALHDLRNFGGETHLAIDQATMNKLIPKIEDLEIRYRIVIELTEADGGGFDVAVKEKPRTMGRSAKSPARIAMEALEPGDTVALDASVHAQVLGIQQALRKSLPSRRYSARMKGDRLHVRRVDGVLTKADEPKRIPFFFAFQDMQLGQVRTSGIENLDYLTSLAPRQKALHNMEFSVTLEGDEVQVKRTL